MSFRRTALLSLLLAGGLACGSSEPKQTPTAISLASSSSLAGVVGQPLTPAPEIVVKDQNGNPIAGIPLTITVSTGGGTLANAATSTTSGSTPIGTLTLGTVAGTTTITVNAAGLTPLVISVTVQPGPPAGFSVVSGGNQSAPAGTAIGPIQLAVRDQYGNRTPASIPVSFSVVAGDGILAAFSATTDATGLVTVPAFTLGKSAVPQTIRAQAAGFFVDIVATVSTSFNIDVRFFGTTTTDAQKAIFIAAANRLRAAIVSTPIGRAIRLTKTSVQLANECQITGQPDFNEAINGIVIYASIQPIDGPKSILAQSGPCYGVSDATQTTKATQIFPLLGRMIFDSADLDLLTNGGNLQDVVEHEMMHVLGYGTVWSDLGLVADTGTTNPRYVGAGGVQGCREIGATSTCALSVPVEGLPAKPGTRDGHWRESVFVNELMTGFLNPGAPNPLSVMSIRSMSDIGYNVNTSAADPYLFPGTAFRAGAGAGAGGAALWEGWEVNNSIQVVTDMKGNVIKRASPSAASVRGGTP